MQTNPRVLLETLGLSKNNSSTWIYEIAAKSRCTQERVKEDLSHVLNRQIAEELRLTPKERLDVALAAAKLGRLSETVKVLDWHEFEMFAEECLQIAGYQTNRNVRFNDGDRRWEIDVVAQKSSMILCLDCKHWARGSPQKLRDALIRQREATRSLNQVRQGQLDYLPRWALPIVLTLFDVEAPQTGEGVLVPIGRFQDFLEHLTHVDPMIPFIPPSQEQKPIR